LSFALIRHLRHLQETHLLGVYPTRPEAEFIKTKVGHQQYCKIVEVDLPVTSTRVKSYLKHRNLLQ